MSVVVRNSRGRRNALALEVWQQKQRGKEQEGREGDAVEDAHDDHGSQHGRGQDAGTLLRLGLAACLAGSGAEMAYLVSHDALDQHQSPAHEQRLEAVGEGVRLEGPGDVGRGDQGHGDASGAGRLDQLMDGPVLHDDAQGEHQHAQGPVDDRGRDVVAEALAQPAQDVHGPAVCEP